MARLPTLSGAFIYATVLEGAVKSQINGGELKGFTNGQNWFKAPGDDYQVSSNASQTEPAKPLAVFVGDTSVTKLTVPH